MQTYITSVTISLFAPFDLVVGCGARIAQMLPPPISGCNNGKTGRTFCLTTRFGRNKIQARPSLGSLQGKRMYGVSRRDIDTESPSSCGAVRGGLPPAYRSTGPGRTW